MDARSGQSRLGDTTGVVMGNKALRIARGSAGSSRNALKGNEYLLPVFDAAGAIVGYERSMDPAKLAGLQKDTHLGRMLGAWTGRIAEESMAEEFNRDLLKVIKQTYDLQSKDPVKYPNVKWVNVADKKNVDPMVRDAWNALGWKIKADAVLKGAAPRRNSSRAHTPQELQSPRKSPPRRV